MRRHLALSCLVLAAVPAFAQTLPGRLPATPPDRGALLYETHCGACHTTQMHWRDKRVATDWFTLKAQVRRWQDVEHLDWTEADIEEVARHLDERFYRFRTPGVRRISRDATPPAG